MLSNTDKQSLLIARLLPGHSKRSEPSESLLYHPQTHFCLFAAPPLRFGLPVSFRGRASAMAQTASDSAVIRAFAFAARRSVYHRASGATASLVSSAAVTDSIFISPDCRRKSEASRRSPLPQIANSAARRSESRSPLGPASINGSHPPRRSFLPVAVTL